MHYMTNSQIPGVGHIGQIAQMPDGQLYQLSQAIDGLGNVGQAWLPVDGIGQSPYDQPQLGEIRRGADGQLYQYAQTVDGLGNVGFAFLAPLMSALPAVASAVGSLFRGGRAPAPTVPAPHITPVTPSASGGNVTDLTRLAPQIARIVASLLSSRRRRAMLRAGAPFLSGLDADPYELGLAEDPYLYGLDADPYELGLAEDPYLYGLDADPYELGLAEDDPRLGEDGSLYQFQGLDETFDDLRGFGAYPDDLGLAEDELLRGVEGYLQQTPQDRIQGYMKGHPSASPRFVPNATPSPLWQSLW
jgi:hypothetical protein